MAGENVIEGCIVEISTLVGIKLLTNDFTVVKFDDDCKVSLSLRGKDVSDRSCHYSVRTFCRLLLANKIWRGCVSASIAGAGNVSPRLYGDESPLFHESAGPSRQAIDSSSASSYIILRYP